MRHGAAWLSIAFCAVCAPLRAEEIGTAKEHPAHGELRAVRDGLVAATNKGDVDAMLVYCHKNIRFTTPDARVHSGHEGVRKYLDEMMKGPDAYVKSFKADVAVDDLAVLYGETMAVATGTSADQFEVAGRNKFTLNNRWSATLVKENGKWLVANYHTATNVFDNPILALAKGSLYWVGGVALVVGIGIGALVLWLLRRSSTRPAATA